MPSAPGYHRNYVQEDKTAKARGEEGVGSKSGNAERGRLRRAALKRGLVKKGQDLDHRVPLSKGGANTLANARAETPHDNRSFPRTSTGALKVNHPKTPDPRKKK